MLAHSIAPWMHTPVADVPIPRILLNKTFAQTRFAMWLRSSDKVIFHAVINSLPCSSPTPAAAPVAAVIGALASTQRSTISAHAK